MPSAWPPVAGGPVALVDDDLYENLNRPGSLQTLVETATESGRGGGIGPLRR